MNADGRRKTLSLPRTIAAVALFAVCCGAGLAFFYSSQPSVYTAEAQLLYSRSDPSQALTGRASVALALDALEPVISDAVAEEAAEALDISQTELNRRATVEPSRTGASLLIEGTGSTPEKAQTFVRTLGDAYISTESRGAIESLTRQAESLTAPIAELEGLLAAAPEEATVADELRQSAQLQQLSELQTTRTRLLVAAAQYPGQIGYLVTPKVPTSPSSFTAVEGAAQGLILGALAGGGLAVALRSRVSGSRHRADGRVASSTSSDGRSGPSETPDSHRVPASASARAAEDWGR